MQVSLTNGQAYFFLPEFFTSINMTWILALGFLAQSMFGARNIVQLVHTERAGKVTSPSAYWQLSMLGSFLFLIYGIIRNDIVIMLGQTLSYFIYVRNLQLKNAWAEIHIILRFILLLLPIGTLVWVFYGSEQGGKFSEILNSNDFADPILFIGGTGQLLLNLRFVYQWFYSEKTGVSTLPIGFWLISVIASVMILVYAVQRMDIVLLGAQSIGIFAYLRNIFIHYRSLYRK